MSRVVRDINRHAGVNGTSLKEIINTALPPDIISLRFSQNRGPLHNDDDFLLATEEAGRHYEELKRTLKMRTYFDGERKVIYFGQEDKVESRDRKGGRSGRKDKEKDRRRTENPGNKDKQGPKEEKKEKKGYNNGAASEMPSLASTKATSTRTKQRAEKIVVGDVA